MLPFCRVSFSRKSRLHEIERIGPSNIGTSYIDICSGKKAAWTLQTANEKHLYYKTPQILYYIILSSIMRIQV